MCHRREFLYLGVFISHELAFIAEASHSLNERCCCMICRIKPLLRLILVNCSRWKFSKSVNYPAIVVHSNAGNCFARGHFFNKHHPTQWSLSHICCNIFTVKATVFITVHCSNGSTGLVSELFREVLEGKLETKHFSCFVLKM